MHWHLYILDCDGRYYTGIALDPARRLEEHRAGKPHGARFTRGARRIELVYCVRLGDRSLALRAEARIRKLRRDRKTAIVRDQPPRDALLQAVALHALP